MRRGVDRGIETLTDRKVRKKKCRKKRRRGKTNDGEEEGDDGVT